MAHVGTIPDVIIGETCQAIAAQQVDAAVADMEEMGAGRFQHHRTEGGDAAVVFLGLVVTLAVQPVVEGGQYLQRGFFYRPGLRRAEVILQETDDTGMAGLLFR